VTLQVNEVVLFLEQPKVQTNSTGQRVEKDSYKPSHKPPADRTA